MMERPRLLKLWADPSHRAGLGGKPPLGPAVLAWLVFLALQGWWLLVPAPALQAGPQVVEIPAHLGVLSVARTLEQAGGIRSPLGLAVLGTLRGSAPGLRRGGSPSFLRSLGIEAESLEGYLFPATYHFIKGMTAEEMLARMVQRLREQVTPEILAQAEARGLTLHQLLTLASIIEREAIAPQERPLISAVFWNRLRRGRPR